VPSPGSIALPGTSWVLSSNVEDEATDLVLPEGLLFTIAFSETDVVGTAVCAPYTAPYTASPDGTITISDIVVTPEPCPEDDGTAQTAYLEALQAASTYDATPSRLVLATPDGTRLVYLPVVPEASPSGSPPPG
jgi:heat shock protein HslJ